jgi:hypothetical protein
MKQKGFSSNVIVAIIGALVLALASGQAIAQKKKVYRWVDDEGNVHYSETLPPDWKGESHDELSGHGIVTDEAVSHAPPPAEEEPDPAAAKGELPRDKSGMKRPDPLYSDAEKQDRMDRLLMLRYHSEEEMMEAMDVEINQLKYDERLLTSTHNSLRSSLKSNIDLAGHRQRAGLAVGENELKQISNLRASLKENENSLRGLEIREQNIRAEFERDLERYRELVELYSEEDS